MTQDPEGPQPQGPAPENPDDIEIDLLGEPPAAEAAPAEPPEPDFAELPEVQPPSAGPDSGTLVIETEDLLDVPDVTPGQMPWPAELPPVDTRPLMGAPGYKTGKGEGLAVGLVGSMLLQMLIAGAVGGVLAWMVAEPGARARELNPLAQAQGLSLIVEMAMFGGALGGLIGLALGAVEGIVVVAWSRAVTGGVLGLLIGGAGGAFGGVAGQWIFALILGSAGRGNDLETETRVIAARAIGWALVGAFVGLGPGVMMMAPKKMINGLLGGLAGGFIAGIMFDPIGSFFQISETVGGTPSRFVGIVVLGMCTGCGIGLVEEMRKEAWLILVAGPLAGKQFILYKPATWIGSAPGMDIPLVKDRSIAPKHCVLEMAGGGHAVRALNAQTLVNGRPVTAQRLGDGDVIQIGQTGLQYHTRPMLAGLEVR